MCVCLIGQEPVKYLISFADKVENHPIQLGKERTRGEGAGEGRGEERF